MIFITGGSGFVGRHLIKRLTDEGKQVRSLATRQDEAENLVRGGTEVVMGGIGDYDAILKGMKGAEAAVHLVAILREKGAATFEAVNVQGTKNVIKAATEAGVKKLVHIAALGNTPDPKYTYLNSKWRAAEAVRASELNYTIFEPSVLFGPGAGLIESLLGTLKMVPFVVPIVGKGDTKFQPFWVEDLVSCIVKALAGEKNRQICQVGGPQHLSYEQVLDEVMAARDTKKLKLHLPLWFMRPAVSLMSKILKNPPITKGELKSLEIDTITDLDVVEQQFGFKPLPLNKGLGFLNGQRRI